MQRRSFFQKGKGALNVLRSCFVITRVLIPALCRIFRLLLFFLKIIVPEEDAGGRMIWASQ